MNIDIVSSKMTEAEKVKVLVNYGEPNPKRVYTVAFGATPPAEIIPKIKTVIEELDDELWEIFSLEFGDDTKTVSFWLSTDLFSDYTPDQLREDYARAIELFRQGCQERGIAIQSST